jgi:hypothetical protein
MNPEQIGKKIVEQLLMENFTEKVSLYPGAFKPPHRGHVSIALDSLETDTDKLILFISTKAREDVEVEEALKAWELYKESVPGLERMEIVPTPTPVKDVYDYVKNNPTHDIKAVFGKGEENRYTSLATKYPNVEIFNAGTVGNYSATDLRQAIRNKDKEAISTFIPDGVNIDDFLSIFQIQENLNEIGDLSVEPYKWNADLNKTDKNDPYDYYDFTTDDGIKYQVVFLREPIGNDAYINYDMSFVAKGGGDKGFSANALTGGNEPLKVMSTVVDITKSHMEYKGDADFITFEPTKGKTGEESAKDSTRGKLYKLIIKKNFPKAQVAGTDKVTVDVSAYKGEDMFEAVVGDKIVCDNCGWDWKIKDGGDDLYMCHKCGHDNTPSNLQEKVNPELESQIKDYIEDYSEINVDFLKNLLKDKKKYPQELDPRTGGNKYGYRGTTFDKEFISKLKVKNQLNGVTEYEVPSNLNITSKGDKGFLSFSTDEDVAKGFGHYSGYVDHKKSPDKVGGYVKVSLDNPNFILHPDYMSKLSQDMEYSKETEKETLYIGNSYSPESIYVVDEKYKLNEVKYTNPNFDNEWEEAERYSEFVKMGKQGWINVAKKGYVTSYSKIKNVLGNVDLKFDKLEEPKKQRFQDAFKKGTIEMSIAVKFSDNDYDLVAGNTRLSGLVKNGEDPKIWIVDLSKSSSKLENKYLQEARYKKFLNEGWDSSKAKIINTFLEYCSDYLSVTRPTIKLVNSPEYTQTYHSFGGYMPSEQKIITVVHNRNMADILRTLAHEMVHHMQNLDERLTPKSGEDGSPDENEANSLAGVIMREFGRNNPHIYE